MGIRRARAAIGLTDLMGWPQHVVKKHYMHVTDEIRHGVTERLNELS